MYFILKKFISPFKKHVQNNFRAEATPLRNQDSIVSAEENPYDEAVCDCENCQSENVITRSHECRRHRPESDYLYEIHNPNDPSID